MPVSIYDKRGGGVYTSMRKTPYMVDEYNNYIREEDVSVTRL